MSLLIHKMYSEKQFHFIHFYLFCRQMSASLASEGSGESKHYPIIKPRNSFVDPQLPYGKLFSRLDTLNLHSGTLRNVMGQFDFGIGSLQGIPGQGVDLQDSVGTSGRIARQGTRVDHQRRLEDGFGKWR